MIKNWVLMVLLMSFTLVQAQDKNACQTASHDIVQAFIGEWGEYSIENGKESFIGNLSTQLDVENCMLTQSFSTPDSTFSYRSQGFVNPASKIWEETYVFNSGRYAKYLWIVDGETLYTLRVDSSQPSDHLHRLFYTEIRKDEYLVVQQSSRDGGRQWISKDSTRIRKLNAN